MEGRFTKYARPALWGFFICVVATIALVGLRFFIPVFVTQRWESERPLKRAHIEQVIRRAFQERVDELFTIAACVTTDTLITSGITTNEVADIRKAFQHLETYRSREELTLDLVDLQGNVLLWSGPSITSSYLAVLQSNPSQRFVRVTQSGLRTYLSVGIGEQQNQVYLIVSEPLEVNYPISNRFVKKVSFCANLSQDVKAQIVLNPHPNATGHTEEFIIPIKDQDGKIITAFSVTETNVEGEIVSAVETCTLFITCCLACGILLIAFASIIWIARKKVGWLTILVCILCVWLVRLVWRATEFPAILMNGSFFNPSLYASPFIFGLSSSLGELVFSTLALVLTAWLFMRGVLFTNGSENVIAQVGKRLGRVGTFVFLFVISLIILWILRGFGEALRSFVFDSTLKYNNPSEIIPEGTTAIMQLVILLLGFSLIGVSLTLLWFGKKLLSAQFSQNEIRTRIIFSSIYLFCIPLFRFLDENQQVSLYSQLSLIILIFVLMELKLKWEKEKLNVISQKWRLARWMLLSAFILGTPIVHAKLQQKDYRNAENAAKELLRPSDSWLTYIVLDGLHTSADELLKVATTTGLSMAKENNFAFVLWAKTLLGKEGYNSALVLYDNRGNEVDRFVVGVNKPEQQDILTKVFEGEEDAIHVLPRTESKTMGKLYGAWTTVRDSSGQLMGSLALLLSEHQKQIFDEEEAGPLRQIADRFESEVIREIAIHEFRNDSLIFSTGKKLYPDRFLPISVKNELRHTEGSLIWKEWTINNQRSNTVFVEDVTVPERVVAISLEEMDYRWSLFSYLKELIIYLASLLVLGIGALLNNKEQGLLRTIGFRGRLFLGFSCIALLPLIILSYYNKQLVADKVKEQTTTTLYRELNQLKDRIGTYIADREDFIHGIDDDFCDALATEYGIDFSIYYQSAIQASSRAELYRVSLLDRRLNGEVFASTILGGINNFLATEKIGSVEYVVGYTPLYVDNNIVGVLAIPTLNRQKEIEAELAQRNAYVFGIYAAVFGLALLGGGFLAMRFARPLHELTYAAKTVSRGNLNVMVDIHSQDEIGELAQSFNDMVMKLNESRIELAKHERESAWKEMAKQVAHEIRNPLTPMKLSIQHIRQTFKDKAPEREEILQRITQTVIEQIETLSRIATEFSNFAKLPESKFEKFKVDDLLTETVGLFREAKGLDFVIRLGCDATLIVADRDKLRGVFINIIKNAIQAIEEAGKITIETMSEGSVCLVRISDTGQGISEELQSKIFEPNFSTKTEGMGLGLAIARRVIEDHGGTISCLSEQGKGTTFEIRLPV